MKRALTLAVLGLLVMAGAAYAAHATGTFTGNTSQHQSMNATITSSNAVKSTHYQANYTCRDSHHHVVGHAVGVGTDLPTFHLSSKGTVDHKFSLLHATDKIHLVGKASGTHFTGSFHEVYISQAHHRCDSGTVTFDISHP